jgi:hypothetical protein
MHFELSSSFGRLSLVFRPDSRLDSEALDAKRHEPTTQREHAARATRMGLDEFAGA